MTQINSRADIEALRGTSEFIFLMRDIYGSLTQWSLVDGAWVATDDTATIDRLGYTLESFMAEIEGLNFPAPEAPPLPPAVPNVPAAFPLSSRQLRLGLIRHGFGLSSVAAVIAAIPDEAARDEATVWWEYSDPINWDHPMTQMLIGLMGISLADAEAMWMVAKDYDA